jgi:D-threonate/D-erythronate kinase
VSLLSAFSGRAQPAPCSSLSAQIRLLADDLTGACDTGVAFLRASPGVRVWTGDRALFDSPEPAQAVVTRSRNLAAGEAATAVSRAAAALRSPDRSLVFKKVDSTLRGPVAAELMAARQVLGARAILFAPAFPALGRTVSRGMLDAEDASESRQRLYIRDLFPTDLDNSIAPISRAEELAPALDSGRTILICDSVTHEDLVMLARASQSLPGLLYAGSGGLARAIATLYASDTVPQELPACARTLLICGTAHPVTKLQLGKVDLRRLPDATVLRICCQSGDEERVREAFTSVDPEALVLTGGDTALLALRALGAHSLLLRGEVAPGIPWAVAQGGSAQDRIIVTKSGGFGAAIALNQILHALAGLK